MHTELSGPVLAPLSDLAAANGNAPDHPVVRHAPAALTLSTPSAVTPFAWAALVSAGSAPPGDSGDLEQRRDNLPDLDKSIRPLLSAPESAGSAATVEQLLGEAPDREGQLLDVRAFLAHHADLEVRPFDLDRVYAASTDAREPGMINNIRARVQAAGGAPVVVGASCLHVAKLHEHLREEFNVVVVSSFMTGTGDTRVTPFSRQRSSYLLHCKDHKVLALRASGARIAAVQLHRFGDRARHPVRAREHRGVGRRFIVLALSRRSGGRRSSAAAAGAFAARRQTPPASRRRRSSSSLIGSSSMSSPLSGARHAACAA